MKRTAMVLFASAGLGACASPSYPIMASAPATMPAPPPPVVAAPPPESDGAVPTAPPPSAPVEVRPLDLPPPAPAATVEPPPPAAPAFEPAPPPRPTFRTVTTRSVTGRVVNADGPARTYEVKRGDNLARVAERLDTDIEQLAKDNGLKKPYVIHPGDTLKGPGTTVKAYVVEQGDTLSAISRRFGVSVDDLRGANDLGRNATLLPGRRLRLPDGYRDRGPIVTTTQVRTDAPSTASRAAPLPVATAEPDDAPQTDTRSVTVRSVTGRVIEVDGPAKTYKVKKGDNLERVADRLDTDIEQLATDNKLKKPYLIRPGQTLRGPRTSAKAYVVGSGDTLAAVGRRFGVSVEALRSQNGLSRNASLAPGRRLRLPAGYRDRGPIVTTRVTETAPPPAPRVVEARPEPPAPALPSAPQPYSGRASAPPAQRPSAPPPRQATTPSRPFVFGGPVASPPTSDDQIAQLGRGRFIWPVLGEVISDFGPKATGQRNDGIDIRAALGDPVRAAAAGDVVYAGDQVPGFGNLVLIKHPDGWTTAYAHLSRVEVRMQQKVTQGQQIGQAGASGGVSEPRLHFEVRYVPTPDDKPRAVNPNLVLPR